VVDDEVMSANPDLRMIASQAITPDRIDVPAATARGIAVTLVPPIVTEATADIAFGLLLAVARRILDGDRTIRDGLFPGGQSAYLLGSDVTGKTLGLIGGRGRIGRALARRASGFDMRVLYWGRGRMTDEEEAETGIEFRELDDLLRESDFVSVHSALTEENQHLVGEREFRIMKPTAYLINTARGPIVHEAALAKAVKDGEIAGAGIDVFENEPAVDQDLLACTNVVLTPHLGSAAIEVRERMADVVAGNIVAFLEGRVPPNCVNPEALETASGNSAGSLAG
jgi:glyoxylate reductase